MSSVNPRAMFEGRPLRVLHGTYEIAGQGMMLARALRELGVEAKSLTYKVDWDGRIPDLVVDLDRHRTPIGKLTSMGTAFARHAGEFDVFHFHAGTTFINSGRDWLGGFDLPLLKSMGKTIVFHFHGCEIRRRAHMIANHRLATCTECRPFCDPRRQDRLLAQAHRYADLVFFSTLDLAESVPMGRHLPLAIEADRWERAALDHPLEDFFVRDGVRGPTVVAHAPTDFILGEWRGIKGTRHIEAAIEQLRPEFPQLEYRRIERQPWATMPEFLSQCDILVDQLMMGWYGLLAIEGMCVRRPVISYLRDDFRDRLEGCPVQSATPETIASVLRRLIADPPRRLQLGQQGIDYARAFHDLRAVGNVLLAHYQEALARRSGSGAGARA
jgi:glycosyltransferase involved in cell wall biosynthesis